MPTPPLCHRRYLRDVKGQLQLRSLSTGELRQEFELPGVGSVTGFSGACCCFRVVCCWSVVVGEGEFELPGVGSVTGFSGACRCFCVACQRWWEWDVALAFQSLYQEFELVTSAFRNNQPPSSACL